MMCERGTGCSGAADKWGSWSGIWGRGSWVLYLGRAPSASQLKFGGIHGMKVGWWDARVWCWWEGVCLLRTV